MCELYINIFFGVVLMSFGVFCCGFVWFVVIRWTSRDFLNINGGSIRFKFEVSSQVCLTLEKRLTDPGCPY